MENTLKNIGKYRYIGLGILIGFIMVFGMIQTAKADAACNLWIGDDKVTSDNHEGEGWSYESTTHTLTLNGFSYNGPGHQEKTNRCAVYYDGLEPLTIILADNSVNTITQQSRQQTTSGNNWYYNVGIYSTEADIIFAGSGSLSVTSGGITGQENIYNPGGTCCSHGVYSQTGDVVFFGGTISVKSGYVSGEGNTIGIESNQVIVNDGIVSVESSYVNNKYGGSIGIRCNNVTVNGGSLSASAMEDTSHNRGTGITGKTQITINGGTVYAEGLKAGITSKNVRMNGGTVTALGSGTENTTISSGDSNYDYEGCFGISGTTGYPVIGNKVVSVTVAGKNSAFSRDVTNRVGGIGWTDYEGVQGETAISATNGHTDLSAYKKVVLSGSITDTQGYNVTIVPDAHMHKKTASGAASQTGLTSAMVPVIYVAEEGFYFPDDYNVDQMNGITVTRNSYTQITVSGTPTDHTTITLPGPAAKTKEITPDVTFSAIDADKGKLCGTMAGMAYQVDGTAYHPINSSGDVLLTGLTACTVQVITLSTDPDTKLDSDPKSFTITKAEAPANLSVHDCTELESSDGKITGTSSLMEYRKSDESTWTKAEGENISGLNQGTYFVRTSPKNLALASDYISLTIGVQVKHIVTFKVENGSWNDGTNTDKIVTLSGNEGSILNLERNQIPEVGGKPAANYKAGTWSPVPAEGDVITADTEYVYSYSPDESADNPSNGTTQPGGNEPANGTTQPGGGEPADGKTPTEGNNTKNGSSSDKTNPKTDPGKPGGQGNQIKQNGNDAGSDSPSQKVMVQERITIKKVPASVKVKAKKNKVTVSWKKIKKNKKGKKLLKQIKSVQVQYSTDPKFRKNTKTKTVGKKKTKVKLKLKKRTTYYVRVRYVGKGGVSKWTKTKKVKTRK